MSKITITCNHNHSNAARTIETPPCLTPPDAPGPQTRAFMAEARSGQCQMCQAWSTCLQRYQDGEVGANWSLCAKCFSEHVRPIQSAPADMAIVETVYEVLNHRRSTPGYGDEWDSLSAYQIDEAARAVAQLLLIKFEITPRVK